MRICSVSSPVGLPCRACGPVLPRPTRQTLLTSQAASRNPSWPHHPPIDRTDTAASVLYSAPRRLHQQQQLAAVQRVQRGAASGPRVCLVSLAHPLAPSQQRRTSKPSSAAAPAKHPSPLLPTHPPAARRAARIPRPRSAAASPVGPAGPCSGRDFPRRFHAACAGRRCRVPWSRSGLVKCCPLGRRRGFPSAVRPSS